MSRPDTLAGLHRKATPPNCQKGQKYFLKVLSKGLQAWYTKLKGQGPESE